MRIMTQASFEICSIPRTFHKFPKALTRMESAENAWEACGCETPRSGGAGALAFKRLLTPTIIESLRQTIVNSRHGHQRKAETTPQSPQPLARRYSGSHRPVSLLPLTPGKRAHRPFHRDAGKTRARWQSRCTSFSPMTKLRSKNCASPKSSPPRSGAWTRKRRANYASSPNSSCAWTASSAG